MSEDLKDIAVRALVNNEREAIGQLWKSLEKLLKQLAIRLQGNQSGTAPSDIVSDVWTTLLSNPEHFRKCLDESASEKDALVHYLLTCVRYRTYQSTRRAKSRKRVDFEVPDETVQAEESSLTIELGASVWALALSEGSDREKRIMELFYKRELSHPEIAAELGITPSNSKQTLKRFRDRMRKQLGEDFYG